MTTGNEGFILAEEAALKALLTGMVVSDRQVHSRPVGVHYRWPDDKVKITYPMVVIDLLDISLATERVESFDWIEPEYIPSVAATASETIQAVRYMPVDLFFQVAVYSLDVRHDRQILSQMWSMERIPPRYGYIDIPEDNTTRRLDVLEYRPSNIISPGGKRVFRQFYTLRINGELSVASIQRAALVTSVNLTVLSQFTELSI